MPVLQPQYEQVGQLWRSYGCCTPTQPKLPLKCRVLVLSPQTTLPELPGPQNHAKTSRPSSRDPKKCPGKSLGARGTFFKTEMPEAASNEVSTNSVINESHLKGAATLLFWIDTLLSLTRNSHSAFINFSISLDDAKIAAGDALKFLGKLTYPEKVPFSYHIHE
jgi:hypothetical protein